MNLKRLYKSCEKQRLREMLVPVNDNTLDLLKKNMEEDLELKQRIAINKASEDPYYRYLVREIAPNLKNAKLIDIIKSTMESSYGFELYFCQSDNNKLTAFIAYIDDGDIIDSLKIFSFLGEKRMNITLAKDLVKFIDDMFKTHTTIMWEALKKNPAISQYNKVCRMFGLDIPEKEEEYKNCEIIKHPESSDLFLYTLKKEDYTPGLQKEVQIFLSKRKN